MVYPGSDRGEPAMDSPACRHEEPLELTWRKGGRIEEPSAEEGRLRREPEEPGERPGARLLSRPTSSSGGRGVMPEMSFVIVRRAVPIGSLELSKVLCQRSVLAAA